MNLEPVRKSMQRKPLACFLAALLASAPVVGCQTQPDAEPAPEGEAARGASATPQSAPLSLRATSVVDGARVEVNLTLAPDGKQLVGSRLVRSPGGEVQEEPVALPFDPNERPAAGQVPGAGLTVPGVDGLTFRIARAESRDGAVVYQLVSNQGHDIGLEIRGDDTSYPIIAAILLILRIGAIAVIVACGFVTYRSLKSCADAGRCWEYRISTICSGTCRNC